MNACPPDEELLPLADAESGIEAEAAVRIHVASCPLCMRRKDRMSAEMRALRGAFTITQSVILRGPGKAPQYAMPATIGKYVIISTLGAGGQATVYRAAHKGLGREVVIKLARRSVKPGDVDLLAAEGKILAELSHPNIARVHDLDVYEGLPYLVMEFVRGRTLEEFARQHTSSPKESAAIVAKVARAIAYAQARGVSHQDISPRNIIMKEDGEPIVIDFGLAKLGNLWADVAESPSGGTPSYMAPEQARLEPGRDAALADVFSLGAVLHFLLAGRSPYRAEPGKALDAAKAGAMDVAPMENVPPEFREVVRKALSAKPSERFSSAAAIAEALEVPAAPKSPTVPRVIVGLGLAAILAIAIWFVVSSAPTQVHPFPQEEQDVLQVTSYSSAVEALPLRDGDRIRAVAHVAHDARVAAYWIAGETVTEMPFDFVLGKDFEIVCAPGANSDVPLKSPRGTEAVVIVASRKKLQSPADRERVRAAFEALIKKNPIGKLPDDTLVRIGISGSSPQIAKSAEGRPIDLSRVGVLPWKQAVAGLEDALKKLSTDGEIDFYAGAAFPTRGEK